MVNDSDFALVDAILKEQPQSWENLITTYGQKVYGIAFRFLTNEKDAEDVVQEVWITVSRRLDTFRGDSQLGTWLYRITVNKCLEKFRSQKRKKTESLDESLPRFNRAGQYLKQYIDWSQKPAVNLENKLLREALRKAINQIPDKYREVIILRDIEGFSGQEVAELLDVSVASVKTRLHRARSFVREKLSLKYGKKPWFSFLRMWVV